MHTTALDNTKIADAVANTYARSLYDLAKAEGKAAETADELQQLVALLDEQAELKSLFELRSITRGRRATSLREIFRGRISDLTYRFLGVLNDKGRLGHLDLIAYAFAQILKEEQGEVDVSVVSARELSGEQQQRIADRIGQAIGRTALVHARVDPSIIGGLTLRIGDKQI
jgi:F-type H+-transporting ATPase subunit delta